MTSDTNVTTVTLEPLPQSTPISTHIYYDCTWLTFMAAFVQYVSNIQQNSILNTDSES